MEFKYYQNRCLDTWTGEQKLVRTFFGVAGEAGELCEKIKKHMRGDYDLDELKNRTRKEIGDVLYYLAVMSHELGFELDDIASENIAKLAKRKEEGKIRGDGDER